MNERATVLVVDGDTATRDPLVVALQGEGHEVVAISDRTSALEAMRRTEFDLLISDVVAFGRDGAELSKASKAYAPDTQVVVATHPDGIDDAIACVHEGAFDFIEKPYRIHAVKATVARALEHQRLRAATALYEASTAVFRGHEPRNLPDVIVDVSVRAIVADSVCLLLPREDGRLYVARATGDPAFEAPSVKDAVAAWVERMLGAPPRPSVIDPGHVHEPLEMESESLVRSSLVYPLRSKERLVGALLFARTKDERPFRPRDLGRAGILASHVELALENSSLVTNLVTTEKLASVGLLSAGVAHEIHTPIGCILATHTYLREQLTTWSRLATLLDGGADAVTLKSMWQESGGDALLVELGGALDDLGEGAARIREIARDLTTLARKDDHALIDINEAVSSALRITAAELRYRAMVSCRLGNDAHVTGSRSKLSQVLVSLLMNASEAFADRRSEENEIVVTTAREGALVLASIADNGPGIAPDQLPRIFETFFTTKGKSSGAGLGLSIGRAIVRCHGGEIRVTSTPGRGATFTIVLPYGQAHEALPPALGA